MHHEIRKMPDKHLSTQFDADLTAVSAQLMEMGGVVEVMIQRATTALIRVDSQTADEVLASEKRVNAFEVSIDREISSIIGRRQPTARDLRLLMAMSKCTLNLERAADEASRVARLVKRLQEVGVLRSLPTADLRVECELTVSLLRKSLDAFARLDAEAALDILRDDDAIDREFEGFVRKLITYMMEDPRMISSALDLLFVAKALERVGDHAKNIAEFIIYIVKGADVRHSSLEQARTAVRS
jgi:phosphate transport system protein